VTCPACAAAVPEGARFCPECGQILAARGDERRIVTVLFADLVGFTTLSENRDPEQVKNLVDRCFERLVADVNAFGGRVDKIVGDAIVALFGAPVAHEDDAERAVRAALQMQRTLQSLTEDLGAEVQLRIGVNTGEVLVGALRAGGDYTAMGDVVNVASRLQTVAGPGNVAVGLATYAATRDVVDYEDLGQQQARGREEPIAAWRAVAAPSPPGYRPSRAPTPLFGRAEELGLLRQALSTAVARRRAHLVLLLGEAGIGKSRLATELATAAAEGHDALVLEGRCVPYGEANVWWPVAEAVRQACGIEPTDPADVSTEKSLAAVNTATGLDIAGPEAARLADGLRYLMGDEDALANVDPQRARDHARRSLLVLLEAQAQRRPLVVVLSELHWADAVVLELVDNVLERLRHLPVMLVATARPELEERWVARAGRHNLVSVHLDPLDADAGRHLLTALLGEEPPPDLRDILLERSGGNPFFLEELVSLLTEAGVLHHDDRGRLNDTRMAQELPATLRGLVAARLDALPPLERAVLEDAAVLGHAGPVAPLTVLAAARGDGDIASVLRTLADKDLLHVLADGEFEFRSELVREVAYETLTKAERARRHAALAEWLTENARKTDREDEFLEQLAHHYGAAAELAQELGSIPGVAEDICDIALNAIERAAVRAKQRDMHAVSIPLLDRALRLLPPGPGRPVRRVLLERARAKALLHELDGARRDLDEVWHQIEGGVHPRSRAKALTVQGHIQQAQGDLAASAASLDEAIEAWRELEDPAGEAEALSLRGMTSLFGGEAEAAEAAIRRALEVFRSLGARREEAWALWNLAWISFEQGDLPRAEERLEKSSAAFDDVGDWGGIGWAQGLLGFVKYFQGKRAEAERIALAVLDTASESGDRWAHGMVLVLLAGVRLWDGRTTEAVEPAAEAIRLFRGMNDVRGHSLAFGILSRALAAAGRVEEAMAVLEDADTVLTPAYQQDMAFIRGGVLAHLGRPDEVIASFSRYAESKVFGEDVVRSPALALYGLAELQAGRHQEAVVDLEQAVDAAVADGPRANALAVSALAQVATGKPDAAREAAAAALEIEARTYLDTMTALVARAFASVQAGDVLGATTAFQAAQDTVDASGDRVNQATVRLARGLGEAALGVGRADAVLEEGRARLAAIGLDGCSWEQAFRAAAGIDDPSSSRFGVGLTTPRS
jgi:class 3 adenylate cyclase/tetratricopeptide (TPR) repeat protein